MLTEKDNYLMTLRGETPEWIPRLLIPSPGHAPATAWIGPGFLNCLLYTSPSPRDTR